MEVKKEVSSVVAMETVVALTCVWTKAVVGSCRGLLAGAAHDVVWPKDTRSSQGSLNSVNGLTMKYLKAVNYVI